MAAENRTAEPQMAVDGIVDSEERQVGRIRRILDEVRRYPLFPSRCCSSSW